VIRLAYFGLPLGALLLARDGLSPSLVVLSPVQAPGRRRLQRLSDAAVLDARDSSAGILSASIDAALQRAAPDLVVSWYFTRRIEERWLALAGLGGIGAHPSLLPRHRGPNPFFAAIDEGDRVTGVSVHRLTPAYDEGDVLATEAIPVGDRDAWQLARALDRPSLRLLRRVVRDVANGVKIHGTPQDAALATWAPEPSGELLHADFRWSTERVLRRIRALSPVPGLALEVRGVELFVTRAEPATDYPLALHPGEASIRKNVVIRTGDGAIAVTRAAVFPDDASQDVTILKAEELALRLRA
jgi:methionyl-tRNA formyltransferase